MFQFFRHPVLLGALINAVNAKITLDETSIEDFDKITSLADETLYFEVFKEKYDRNSFNLQITPYLNEFERFFVASKVMEYLKIEPFVSGEKWISLPTIDVLKISQKMSLSDFSWHQR